MKKIRINTAATIIIGVAIAVVIGIGIARRCSIQSGSTFIEKYTRPRNDTLSVAIEMSPLTYSLQNDTAEGFDFLLLRDIGRIHDVPMTFHPVAQLEKAFEGLNNGSYDIVVASIPSTKTLKKYFPVTEPVYLDKQVLVQRADTAGGKGPISSQEFLRDDTVWIPEGSPIRTRLNNMAKELGDTIVILTDPKYSAEQLTILTALGEIRHAVVNEAVARRIAKDYPLLDISTPISFTQFQCWAVAPGDTALVDSLNVWLQDFKQTEKYRALSERYL